MGKANKQEMAIQLSECMRRLDLRGGGGGGGATGRGKVSSSATAAAAAAGDGAEEHFNAVAELMQHLQLGAGGGGGIRGGEAATSSSTVAPAMRARSNKMKTKAPRTKSSSCRGAAAADVLAPKGKAKKKKTTKGKKRRLTETDIWAMAINTRGSYVYNEPAVIAAVIRARQEDIELYKRMAETMRRAVDAAERNVADVLGRKVNKESAEKRAARYQVMKEDAMSGIRRTTVQIAALEDANRRDLDRATRSPRA